MTLEVEKSRLGDFADDRRYAQNEGDRLNSGKAATEALVSWLKKFIFGDSDLSAVNDNSNEALSLTDEGVRAFVDETVYRTRRYQRPLSIILFRIGQKGSTAHPRNVVPKIASQLRRLDLCILLDPEDMFLVLCPELDDEGIGGIALRLTMLVEEHSGSPDIDILSATATLPGVATTFDDLLGLARQRLEHLSVSAVRP